MWQIAYVEWAVLVFMAFVVAARDGNLINSKCKDGGCITMSTLRPRVCVFSRYGRPLWPT